MYPNLGVTDAFVAVRQGARQWAVRFSDALAERSTALRVLDYRIKVLEPPEPGRAERSHDRCRSRWDRPGSPGDPIQDASSGSSSLMTRGTLRSLTELTDDHGMPLGR